MATLERFVLTQKELHLGHLKETFRRGAVIEHDEEKHLLFVDGREFKDTRDLDVLKRQADRDPDNAWIVPWSEKAVRMARASFPSPEPKRKPKPGEGMKVVQSDEDLMDTDIDIRDTQVSKKNAAAKEASRKKAKVARMEIIRGDETVEDRIASLKGKNDIGSMSERVRLKSTGSAKMPVVKDDSLGSVAGSRATALNAGQPIPSRDAVEAKTAVAKARADERKKEVETRRPGRPKGTRKGSATAGQDEVALLDADKTPVGPSEPVREVSGGSDMPRRPVTSAKMARRLVGV
jgi:hypothetical protein